MKQEPDRGIRVEESVRIARPAATLYHVWRDFHNLPKIMKHLDEVIVLDGKRSHWVAKGPLGKRVEWDAEIIHEEPDRQISWQSISGSDVASAGSVRFLPDERDRSITEVRVVLRYAPPAGKLGEAVASLFGDSASQQIRDDLEHFREWMERDGAAGELARADAARGPGGRGRAEPID
ncbi:MAG: SRPBCC family protein [Candidatus Eisenbacteria bacterium]